MGLAGSVTHAKSSESIALSAQGCYKLFTHSGRSIHLAARIINSDSPPRGQTMPERPQYDQFVSHAVADRAWVEGYLLNTPNQAGGRVHSEASLASTHFVRADCTLGGHALWP